MLTIEELDNEFTQFLHRKLSKEDLEKKRLAKEMLTKALRNETKELLIGLSKIKIEISSIWDLVNTSKSYKEAIPLLITHLKKTYYYKNKEGIVRSLAVKEAKGLACKAIIDEYLNTPKNINKGYRWAFGNTMDVIITKEYVDDVISIVLDKSNGESRHMFVRALGKIKLPKVKDTLEKLLEDNDELIKKEAKKKLAKF